VFSKNINYLLHVLFAILFVSPLTGVAKVHTRAHTESERQRERDSPDFTFPIKLLLLLLEVSFFLSLPEGLQR